LGIFLATFLSAAEANEGNLTDPQLGILAWIAAIPEALANGEYSSPLAIFIS
jgi:hypothetical protein